MRFKSYISIFFAIIYWVSFPAAASAPLICWSLQEECKIEEFAKEWQIKHPKSEVVVINHSDDFIRYQLAETLKLTPTNRYHRSEGPLYNGDSLILIINFPEIDNTTEFNELFDDQPAWNGQPLGDNKQLIGVVRSTMLTDSKYGQDFWNRAKRNPVQDGNTPIFSALLREDQSQQESSGGNTCTTKSYTAKGYTTEDYTSKLTHVVDSYLYNDWLSPLVGEVRINQQGDIHFEPGIFHRLQSGDLIEFKGAAVDSGLQSFLATTSARGWFRSNGKKCELPKKYTIRFTDINPDAINNLINRLVTPDEMSHGSHPKTVVINEVNINDLLAGSAIHEETGNLVSTRTVYNWLQHADCLRISSPLEMDSWLRLKSRMDDCESLRNVKLLIDSTYNQPPFITEKITSNRSALPGNSITVDSLPEHAKLIITDDPEYLRNVTYEKKPSIILNSGMTIDDLLGQKNVISVKKRHFSFQPGVLCEAMKNGEPVYIYGLEHADDLQLGLEPLLSGYPALLVNGWLLEAKPGFELNIIWQNGCEANGSAILKRLLKQVRLQNTGACLSPDKQELTPLAYSTTFNFAIAKSRVNKSQGASKDQQIKQLIQRLHYASKILGDSIPKASYSSLRMLRTALSLLPETKLGDLPVSEIYKVVDDIFLSRNVLDPQRKAFYHVLMQLEYPDTAASYPSCHLEELLAKYNLDGQYGILSDEVLKKHFWEFAAALRLGCTCYEEDDFINNPQKIRSEIQDKIRAHRNPESFSDNHTRPDNRIKKGYSPTLSNLLSYFTPQTQLEKESPFGLKIVAGDNFNSWYEKKLEQLTTLSQKHRLVLYQGATGTGKSHTAKDVASRIAPGKKPLVIQAGANMEYSELFRIFKLRETAPALDDTSDRYSEQLPGILHKWINGQQPVLIIDEVNLAPPCFWKFLQGFSDQEPWLSDHGTPINIDPNCRIIVTCNPQHYRGRHNNDWMKQQGPTVRFDSVPMDYLKDHLLIPSLNKNISKIILRKQAAFTAASRMADLFLLMIKHGFVYREITIRDYQEFLARVEYLINLLEEKSESSNTLYRCLPRQFDPLANALVWEAFSSIFRFEEPTPDNEVVSENLRHWLFSQGYDIPESNELFQLLESQRQNTFYLFGQHLVENTDHFDIQNASTQSYLKALCWQLDKISWHLKNHSSSSTGRTATLIFGPSGRGKDATLKRLLDWYKTSTPELNYVEINLRQSNIDDFTRLLRQCMNEGTVLLAHELNLISSRVLESTLNEPLTSSAKAGFHLFATCNPCGSEYSAREHLSSALLNRTNSIKVNDYSAEDLRTMARNHMPEQAVLTDKLVSWHCALQKKSKNQSLSLRPSAADLFSILQKYTPGPECDDKTTPLWKAFSQHHQIPLMAHMNITQPSQLAFKQYTQKVLPTDTPQLCRLINRAGWHSSPLNVKWFDCKNFRMGDRIGLNLRHEASTRPLSRRIKMMARTVANSQIKPAPNPDHCSLNKRLAHQAEIAARTEKLTEQALEGTGLLAHQVKRFFSGVSSVLPVSAATRRLSIPRTTKLGNDQTVALYRDNEATSKPARYHQSFQKTRPSFIRSEIHSLAGISLNDEIQFEPLETGASKWTQAYPKAMPYSITLDQGKRRDLGAESVELSQGEWLQLMSRDPNEQLKYVSLSDCILDCQPKGSSCLQECFKSAYSFADDNPDEKLQNIPNELLVYFRDQTTGLYYIALNPDYPVNSAQLKIHYLVDTCISDPAIIKDMKILPHPEAICPDETRGRIEELICKYNLRTEIFDGLDENNAKHILDWVRNAGKKSTAAYTAIDLHPELVEKLELKPDLLQQQLLRSQNKNIDKPSIAILLLLYKGIPARKITSPCRTTWIEYFDFSLDHWVSDYLDLRPCFNEFTKEPMPFWCSIENADNMPSVQQLIESNDITGVMTYLLFNADWEASTDEVPNQADSNITPNNCMKAIVTQLLKKPDAIQGVLSQIRLTNALVHQTISSRPLLTARALLEHLAYAIHSSEQATSLLQQAIHYLVYEYNVLHPAEVIKYFLFIEDSTHKTWAKDMLQQFRHMNLTRFTYPVSGEKLLSQEMPRMPSVPFTNNKRYVSYQNTPKGELNLTRLLMDRPAFRCYKFRKSCTGFNFLVDLMSVNQSTANYKDLYLHVKQHFEQREIASSSMNPMPASFYTGKTSFARFAYGAAIPTMIAKALLRAGDATVLSCTQPVTGEYQIGTIPIQTEQQLAKLISNALSSPTPPMDLSSSYYMVSEHHQLCNHDYFDHSDLTTMIRDSIKQLSPEQWMDLYKQWQAQAGNEVL